MAKYCVEDLPNLLKAENLDNVPALLSRLIESLPADAESLIKWVVEVRRKEEGGPSLSKEEKERLFLKVTFLDFCFVFGSWVRLFLPYVTHLHFLCSLAGKCTTASSRYQAICHSP